MPESYEMLEKRANALGVALQTLEKQHKALTAENKALRRKVKNFGKRASWVLRIMRQKMFTMVVIVERENGRASSYARGFVKGAEEAERLLNEAEGLLSEKQIMMEAEKKAEGYSLLEVRDSMKKGNLPEPGETKKPKPTICERCRFWKREVVQENFGLCRRRAPVVDENGHSLFPCVMKNGWCGEFEQKGGRNEQEDC